MVYDGRTMVDRWTHDTTPAAPGDLEVVQRFMNLHEHVSGVDASLPPSRELLESFLREHRLLRDDERVSARDRETALRLHAALHAKVRTNLGESMADGDVTLIDDLSRRAGLHPRFGHDGPSLAPSASGVPGALGRLLAIVFLADLDGSWGHLKECADETCRSVFYDRSKNHSGRWCSMSSCGNRAKVRAWRDRRRADAG
jgi:predicted RNA-binding Zn ribbon-like protein